MSGETRRAGELPPLPRPLGEAAGEQARAATEVDPLIGKVLADRYEIVGPLGAGGMAQVYRAEHRLLRKPVAIKILVPGVEADGGISRFEQEAVTAAKLDHPNTVAITDFGHTDDGKLYLVMELVEGRPLSLLVGQGQRLPWQRAVDLARQVLRGLGRAHELGIVHRDLKGANVMVVEREGGRQAVKIIDFGIAKLLSGSANAPHVETQAGMVFGTADFIAPERLAGEGETDPRSDLYAVGVLLYEMLTGERPFHAEDPYEIVRRALKEAPRPPREVTPDAGIPAALEAIVLRALEKDPARRYGSAREMLDALAPLLAEAGTTDVAFAPGAVARPKLSDAARRRGWIIIGTAGAAAAALLVLGFVRSGHGPAPGSALAPAPAGAASSGPTQDQIGRLVDQAGHGPSVAVRQEAFDRLIAAGWVDRVPWADKLTRDLEQESSCEKRRDVVKELRRLKDPKTLPALEAARARSDNACLQAEADRAIAAVSKGRGGGSGGGRGAGGGGGGSGDYF